MTAVSLRSSTAVIVVLSLLQPLPTLAQSPTHPDGVGGASAEDRNRGADRRMSEEICAEAMILDALACELHILSLEGKVEADTPAAPVERAAPEAAARPDWPAEAREEAVASEEAESREEAASGTEGASEAKAPAEAAIRVEAERAEDAAAQPAPQSEPAVVAQDCLAEIVASDGTIVCADALTGETIAAIATDTDAGADTGADVVVETVTASSSRSSDEEFRDVTREDSVTEAARGSLPPRARERGLRDLEKAGLLVLGAAVVGAILTAGQRVEPNTGDRVIVIDDDGRYRVLKDDDALLRRPGSEVRTERFGEGSTRATVTREDGAKIVTIRDSEGRSLRRVRIEPDGREYLLIDDIRPFEPVVLRDLPRPTYEEISYREATDREACARPCLPPSGATSAAASACGRCATMPRSAPSRRSSTSRPSPSPRIPRRFSRHRPTGCGRSVC
ncbi:MAG: hypothetical protein ACXIU8_05530 [Alkalilacustris sp.]